MSLVKLLQLEQKLFMVVLGCTPPGRAIEQHDIFFGIAATLEELTPAIQAYWPEGRVHIDSWREVCYTDGYRIVVKPRGASGGEAAAYTKLYFINLGGYKPGDLEEYHYKIIIAAPDKGAAVRMSTKTAFYKHTGFKGAESHVDDKYGIDVDDAHEIGDLLSAHDKASFSIHLLPVETAVEDELHIGYIKLS